MIPGDIQKNPTLCAIISLHGQDNGLEVAIPLYTCYRLQIDSMLGEVQMHAIIPGRTAARPG